MIHAKSESDDTSLAPSSPNSPKRPVYYVQSPSRDSHDGDKSSTNQATTPSYNSPMESPTHPSQSRASSESRISGTLRYNNNSGRKTNRKRNDKGWPDQFKLIEEEDEYEDTPGEVTRPCQCLIGLTGLLMVFSFSCLIIWGASRPYRVRVHVKSLTVYNVYAGVGSDHSGVPTKLLTINCSVKMNIYNPATFFGIHVSSGPVNLVYSQITVGRGEVKKYYQPKKSQRTVFVNVEGSKVPLYGAGASLVMSSNGGRVPLKLEFDIKSRGNLVGELVKTKHRRRVSCFLVIDSKNNKLITKLKEDSCRYD